MTDTTDGAVTRFRAGWWHWLAGLVGGLLVLGPGLGPGSLLNLDLVLTPNLQVPTGIWGLGPGLPRSVPVGAPLAWISALIGGPLTGKALIVIAFVAAFAGAARLVAGSAPGVVTEAGAGALYAFSPYLLTRVGVGHLTLVIATAMLPFALPTLLQPSRDLGRTFLWSAAFGFVGFAGALLAGPAVLVGLVCDRGRQGWRVVLGFAVTQLPWVVPGIFVSTQGVRLAGSANFATDAHGIGGYLRVLAGFGFWDPGQQVSLRLGTAAAVFGTLLLGLAIVGTRDLPAAWARRAGALALVGMLLALGSRVPFLSGLYDSFARTPPGEAIRESQRLLPLYLVWLAPAAALGARRIATRAPSWVKEATAALPLAMALVLIGPGLFGLNGRLDPASFPNDWSRAAAARSRVGGTLLALPFSEYVDLSFAGNRRVLNPVSAYFGGDVIFSSDPGLGTAAQERADPREPTARRIVASMLAGQLPARRLAALGVRWVALLHEENWTDFAVLRSDPGLRRVAGGGSIDLYEVLSWKGPAVTRGGASVGVDTPVSPLAHVHSDDPVTWYRPASDGWLRSFDSVGTTKHGLLSVPGGSGPVWYWPTVVVLAADLVTGGLVVIVAVRRGRHRSVRFQ